MKLWSIIVYSPFQSQLNMIIFYSSFLLFAFRYALFNKLFNSATTILSCTHFVDEMLALKNHLLIWNSKWNICYIECISSSSRGWRWNDRRDLVFPFQTPTTSLRSSFVNDALMRKEVDGIFQSALLHNGVFQQWCIFSVAITEYVTREFFIADHWYSCETKNPKLLSYWHYPHSNANDGLSPIWAHLKNFSMSDTLDQGGPELSGGSTFDDTAHLVARRTVRARSRRIPNRLSWALTF